MVFWHFFLAMSEDESGRDTIDASTKELENVERGTVSPVNVFDYQNSCRRCIHDGVQDSVEDLAASSISHSRLQGSTLLDRYVVERSQRARCRQVVTNAPEDADVSPVFLSERAYQAGLTDASLSANENYRSGATTGVFESGVQNVEVCLSLKKVHGRMVQEPLSGVQGLRYPDRVWYHSIIHVPCVFSRTDLENVHAAVGLALLRFRRSALTTADGTRKWCRSEVDPSLNDAVMRVSRASLSRSCWIDSINSLCMWCICLSRASMMLHGLIISQRHQRRIGR